MAAGEALRRDIHVVTFDLYGTVVDMQGGLTEAVTPYLQSKGWSGRPHAFVTWWRRTHFENSMIDSLCDRGHTPYREIGHRSVSHVLERAGIEHTPEEIHWLVSRIEQLRPFADVPAALQRLRRHFRLAILSNGDRDMLDSAKPHLRFEFDDLISVQEAGYFKPHAATYAMAAQRLATAAGNILHVANHPFDCVGAKAAGMRAAYIDRRHRPFGQTPYQPDLVVSDFTALADALLG